MTDEAARKKYDRALRLIEEAQGLLLDACQELYPLIGANEQWELVGRHCDLTKQLWRKVAYSYVRAEVRMNNADPEMEVGSKT